jgi:hypothetical protein
MSDDNEPDAIENKYSDDDTQKTTMTAKKEDNLEMRMPIRVSPKFTPHWMNWPKTCEHWRQINPCRQFSWWYVWPGCKVGTLKTIFSCFLVNVAPGNITVEMRRKSRSDPRIVLDDDEQLLDELVPNKHGKNLISCWVYKKRDAVLWREWSEGTQPELPVIKKGLMEAAKRMVEDCWLDFVREHSELLEIFLKYNEKAWENEIEERKKLEEINKKYNCTMFGAEIQGLVELRKRFEQFRLEVEKQQNENDDKENCESKYARIDELYFHGNPRGW